MDNNEVIKSIRSWRNGLSTDSMNEPLLQVGIMALKGIDSLLRILDILNDSIQQVNGHEAYGPLDYRILRLVESERAWKMALNSLTPGGSEYYDDIQRCVDVVRGTRMTLHNLVIRKVLDNKILLDNLRDATKKCRELDINKTIPLEQWDLWEILIK